ncbi:MAG: hypothetical protein BWK80_35895 [Desulfobacteraceae bacterium IS3]|nr:MAG: hypothetical protein BWK80_35895 [Desulfobacteraceae bacterium IS3]
MSADPFYTYFNLGRSLRSFQHSGKRIGIEPPENHRPRFKTDMENTVFDSELVYKSDRQCLQDFFCGYRSVLNRSRERGTAGSRCPKSDT